MTLYAVDYLILNFSCFLLALILLLHTGNDLASSTQIRLFKLLLFVFCVYMVDDSLWELAVSNIISIPYQVRAVLNAVGLATQPVLCYVWFLFSEVRMHQRLLKKSWFIPVTIAPMIVSITLIFTSLETGLIFYSDAAADYHGPLYDMVMYLDFIYLILVSVHALVKSVRTRSRVARKGLLTMILYVLFPFGAGVFDSIVPNTPAMAPSILLALLWFFVNMQEMQIYTDALTGLNNRRRSDLILEEYIEKASPENEYYVLMIDVNKFKSVNDKYGHMEGDRALQTVASSLMQISGKYSTFLSRWGGDEFMIIGLARVLDPVDEFSELLQKQVVEDAKKSNLSYKLSISVGYSLCSSPQTSPTELTNGADHMLYEAKNLAHQAN